MIPGRTVEMKSAWPGSTPKLPSSPGTTTMATSSESSSFSGETSSNLTLSAIASYAASAAIFFAFSTASSMVPTM